MFFAASMKNSFIFSRLSDCGLTGDGYATLTSTLRSNPSHLIELNLGTNKLGDSGVKHISALLENPHCKLQKLLYVKRLSVYDEA